MTDRSKTLTSILVLSAAVIAAYVNSLCGVFVFDDIPVILRNESVAGRLPMPLDSRVLCNLTFKANLMLFGDNRYAFHSVNILIHTLAAVFLFLTVQSTIRLRRDRGYDIPNETAAALSAALLWGVHPLTTQAVTYICQSYESMTGMFMLAALFFFSRSLCDGRRTRLYTNISLLACMLGMASKEVMISAPAVIFLYDYTFSGDPLSIICKKRKYYYICLLLLTCGLLILWLGTLARTWNLTMTVTADISPLDYIANQSKVICNYLASAVYPARLRFVCSYDILPVTAMLPDIFALTAVLLSSLVLIAKKHPAGFAIISFFTLLAPTSSVVPLPDLYAEQRMYLPLALLISMVVCLAYRIAADRPRIRIWLVSLVTLTAITLAAATHIRNRDYYSELTLWESVTRTDPLNARAHLGMGSAYYNRNMHMEAEACFKNVLLILEDKFHAASAGRRTEYAAALNNLGTIEFDRGRYAIAADYFRKAIDIAPLYKDAVRNLAVCEAAARKNQDKTGH